MDSVVAKEHGYPARKYAVLQVKLPLEVGTFMECEWKQGQYHRAKVIERRKRSDAPDYEYYVHYIGCKFHILLFTFCTPSLHLFECIAVHSPHGLNCATQAALGSLRLHRNSPPLYIATVSTVVMVSLILDDCRHLHCHR